MDNDYHPLPIIQKFLPHLNNQAEVLQWIATERPQMLPFILPQVNHALTKISQVPLFIEHVFTKTRHPSEEEKAVLRQYQDKNPESAYSQTIKLLAKGEKQKIQIKNGEKLKKYLNEEVYKAQQIQQLTKKMIENEEYQQLCTVDSVFPPNLNLLYTHLFTTYQGSKFFHFVQNNYSDKFNIQPHNPEQNIQNMNPSHLISCNADAYQPSNHPNYIFISNSRSQYEKWAQQTIKQQIINNSYPSYKSKVISFYTLTNLLLQQGEKELQKEIKYVGRQMNQLIEKDFFYLNNCFERVKLLYSVYKYNGQQEMNMSLMMVLYVSEKVGQEILMKIFSAIQKKDMKIQHPILLKYLLLFDKIAEKYLQFVPLDSGNQEINELLFQIHFVNQHKIDQLLEKHSLTLTKALNLSKYDLKINNFNQNDEVAFFLNQVKTIRECWHLKNISILSQFTFMAGSFKDILIQWHYLCNSQNSSQFYLNHWSQFMKIQFLRLTIKDFTEKQYQNIILPQIVKGLEYIKKNPLSAHNSSAFYSELNIWKYLYGCLEVKNIEHIDEKYLQKFLQTLIQFIKTRNNHPLIRQYITVIMGRIYLKLRKNYQKIFVDLVGKIDVDLNTGVPILLILGYELVDLQQKSLLPVLLKFISCHSAYIRTICQYYVKKHVRKIEQSDPILCYLCKFWETDKDSIKIMSNIKIVIEGFKEALKGYKEFLDYQRVEEYPQNAVLSQYFFDEKQILSHFKNNIEKPCRKSIQERIEEISPEKQVERIRFQFKQPSVIIVASLLEKVHNFGHIMRTLNGHNAMMVISTPQSLQHPECQELIPENCDVQVIQIKEDELVPFLTLQKERGYPLIALQQCSGSIKLQNYKFPSKFMMLLGNQRIGAPANLLNEADVLVEIEQVGKVRSLNVHVSMVICLWQSFINHI